jgi:hypothetical protein
MKNYKILRISGFYYSSGLENWSRDNPGFVNGSYDEMLKLFFNSEIMYSDGFSRSFRQLDQEAIELVIDFEILQKQWAKENGVSYTKKNWMFDIMMAQIKQIKPDVVYIQSHMFTIPGRFIKDKPDFNLIKILKEEYPFIKKVVIFSGFPSNANRIEGADIFFSSPPSIVDDYRKKGLDPILLYHSFDEGILPKLNGTPDKYGFTFTGMSRAPESRYWALRQLLDQTSLKAWIYKPPQTTQAKSHKVSIKQLVRSALKRGFQLFSDHRVNSLANSSIVPNKLKNIFLEILKNRKVFKGVKIQNRPTTPLNELYPDRCYLPVMGMDMYNLLHQSKITFNKHTDKTWGYVGNVRMFEATGVGSCLVTDSGPNMRDLFEPDKEVVTYSSIDEAVEKVNYLQDHPDEAEQISKAGQARTLRDHTIMNRCRQIDEVIQKLL